MSRSRCSLIVGAIAVLFAVGCNEILGIHELDDDAGTGDGSTEASKDGAVDGPADAKDAADATAPTAPRPIAPLSTSRVTSQEPTLKWQLFTGMDGARVEICKDRGCSNVVQSVDVSGSSGTPTSALTAGVYFWRLHARSGSTVGPTTSVTWEFTVGARSAAVDTSWGTMLDVNGDGYADVAVGARGANKAYVYLGGPSGLSTTVATTLTGPSNSRFGAAVASAGDVNGDGYADLVVAAPGTSTTGQAFVYLGSSTGLATTAATTITDPDNATYFASAVTSAGDVNGDGYADVAIGSPNAPSTSVTGTVYVYLGSASGLPTKAASKVVGLDSPAGEQFGSVVASADVNGDGYSDVVVGADQEGGGTPTGKVYVYVGSSSGMQTTAVTTLLGPAGPGGRFGYFLATGDVNGDGYADLAVGADRAGGSYEGQVYVYAGGSGGVSTAPAITLTGPTGNDFFGDGLTAADVNGDGYDDLVVGAPGGTSGTGNVYVYPGGAGGTASTPAPQLSGPDGNSGQFGSVVVGADVDGDGYADVAIGVPFLNTNTGKAYVYPGTVSGLGTSSKTTLPAQDGANGFYGGALAL